VRLTCIDAKDVVLDEVLVLEFAVEAVPEHHNPPDY
jgi:hypothetical protein